MIAGRYCAVLSVALGAAFLAVLPVGANADDDSAAEANVLSEVAACTQRALSRGDGVSGALGWPVVCAETVHDSCVKAFLSDQVPDSDEDANSSCRYFERSAWRQSADDLRRRLIDRWKECNLAEDAELSMIGRIERLDSTAAAFAGANCAYDEGQWRAVNQPNLAEIRLGNCEAEAEASRAALFFHLLLKDPGCDAENE